jgi:hypothetical protein
MSKSRLDNLKIEFICISPNEKNWFKSLDKNLVHTLNIRQTFVFFIIFNNFYSLSKIAILWIDVLHHLRKAQKQDLSEGSEKPLYSLHKMYISTSINNICTILWTTPFKLCLSLLDFCSVNYQEHANHGNVLVHLKNILEQPEKFP